MEADRGPVRLAQPDEAGEVARLLHDFNTEFGVSSPGPEILAGRLRMLLGVDATVAVLAGAPAVGLALVTFRPNVWYEGPVALLDEMYVAPPWRGRGIGSAIVHRLLALARDRGAELVEINVDEVDVDAQRFYERHGFCGTETPDAPGRSFYYWQELTAPG